LGNKTIIGYPERLSPRHTFPVPTWGKVTTGLVVSLGGWAAWGAYVAFAVAQASARQRADPDPGPDSAGAYTALFYLILTPLVMVPFFSVGLGLCFSRRHRPVGIGMLSGVLMPFLIAVVYRLLLSWQLRMTAV
jgi:hypothetical protein